MSRSKLNLTLLLTALLVSSAQAVGFLQAETKDLSSSSSSSYSDNLEGRLLQDDLFDFGGICGDDFNFLDCLANGETVVGCGALLKKNDDAFCEFGGETACCGDDCCSMSAGAIAGLSIGGVVILALIVLASCACCTCCPFYSKLCCASRSQEAEPEAAVPQEDGQKIDA